MKGLRGISHLSVRHFGIFINYKVIVAFCCCWAVYSQSLVDIHWPWPPYDVGRYVTAWPWLVELI